MSNRLVPVCFFAAALLLVELPSAYAAEFTDLLDAADDFDDLVEETYDPFDFSIEPRFSLDFESARISREAACVPDESNLVGNAAQNNPRLIVDEGRCSEPRTLANKEMDFKRTTSRLDVDLRAGIYKDLEFKLTVPFVFDSTTGLKYADGVDPTNSSVDPDDDFVRGAADAAFRDGDGNTQVTPDTLGTFSGYRFIDLSDEYNEISRSGFADPSISLSWAPFNDERDPTKATLLLGMQYQMPIAPVKTVDNDAVGEGVHELSWRLASSKRFDWIEPYFGLEYILPLAATDSPIRRIDSQNNGQVFADPPQSGKITLGTEFIPHEDKATGARYGVDIRFNFGFTSEGRDYTPLFDHLGQSQCNNRTVADVLPNYDGSGTLTNPDAVACSWIVRQPSNAQPNPEYDLTQPIASGDNDTIYFNDGIMTTESYATFSGLVGVYLQPVKYFQFKAQVGLTHQLEHYLTNARTGRDVADETTDDDTVDLEGPDAALEKNPVHNPAYDQVGNRFRVTAYNTWTIILTAALQF